MTICRLCLKKIPKVKGRRASEEPEFSVCGECQKMRQQIIAKYGVDSNSILNATIRSLVECNSTLFESTADQLRLKHKILAANRELEDTFPGLKERSDQTRLSEFSILTETGSIRRL